MSLGTLTFTLYVHVVKAGIVAAVRTNCVTPFNVRLASSQPPLAADPLGEIVSVDAIPTISPAEPWAKVGNVSVKDTPETAKLYGFVITTLILVVLDGSTTSAPKDFSGTRAPATETCF
jgi:hypothetical protein